MPPKEKETKESEAEKTERLEFQLQVLMDRTNLLNEGYYRQQLLSMQEKQVIALERIADCLESLKDSEKANEDKSDPDEIE